MNTRKQRRRERAADRLVAALAPGSKHRFGTWKRHGEEPVDLNDDGEDVFETTYTDEGEAAARAEAEKCLANLRKKNVRPTE